MGTFRYPIEIGDPQGQHFERLDALVDTGATYTVVPASVLQRLGVTPLERQPFLLGDGRRVEYEIGETRIRVDGRSRTTVVVFGDHRVGAVLGATTLEGFGLAVDPVKQRLVPTDAFFLSMGG